MTKFAIVLMNSLSRTLDGSVDLAAIWAAVVDMDGFQFILDLSLVLGNVCLVCRVTI
jgi:hypothetical protein